MRRELVLAIGFGAALGMSAPAAVEAQVRVGTESQRQRAEQAERQRQEERAREAQRARIRQERDMRAANERRDDDRDRNDRYDNDRNDRYDDRRYDDRYDDRSWDSWDRNNRSRSSNGNGPAFCRSGAGHPVFGRQWCRDKGYRLGNDRGDRDIWEDIILRPRDRRYNTSLNRTVLHDILGAVVLGRFESHARQTGAYGSTSGRWLQDGGANVLQLFTGNVQIARLVDYNRDGRIDSVQLRR